MGQPAFRSLAPAVALAALAFAAPAAAEPARHAFAKSEAIIGGSSKLAAILAQQGAPARSAPAVPTPSAYSAPRPVRAAIGTSPGALSGRPDVFGSLALAVGHTPLDGRWAKVRNGRLGAKDAAFARALRDRPELDRIDAVNRFVNARVRFADDADRFGRADVWTAADDTLRRGLGDCEDYAIAKLQLLRAAGVADRDLYLVIVRDLVRRADHAVLVVRTGSRMLVLDNGTDALLESEAVRDYRPVLTFAETGAWTHGYRVTAPPVQMAAVAPAVLVPAAR